MSEDNNPVGYTYFKLMNDMGAKSEDGLAMSEDKYMEYYDKLVELVKPLYRWFDIDKVKSWAVFVWTKDNLENSWNVFDIEYDGLIFYNEDEFTECDIPVGAFPIIREIQNHLKHGKEQGFYE